MLFAGSSFEDLVSAQFKDRLVQEGFISIAHVDGSPLVLTPQNTEFSELIAQGKKEIKPSFIIEALCLYKKPETHAKNWTLAEKTMLFNGITALSTLTGLYYYSTSRKQKRLFYEESAVIASPNDPKPQPDPSFSPRQLPERLKLYAKQKDLTLGENIYCYDFTVKDDRIFLLQENLTTVFYGVVPVLGKQKLRSFIAVFDTGDALLISMVSMAATASIPGMKNKIAASFSTRSEALIEWFKTKADAVYQPQKPE